MFKYNYGGLYMTVHKIKKLSDAARKLANDKSSEATKKKASVILNTHKKKKH